MQVGSFKDRDGWDRDVMADHTLTVAQRLVAVRLSHYWFQDTGRCDPAYGSLAGALHLDRGTVIAAIAALEARGWIAIDRSRGRRCNAYRMLRPGSATVAEDQPLPAPTVAPGPPLERSTVAPGQPFKASGNANGGTSATSTVAQAPPQRLSGDNPISDSSDLKSKQASVLAGELVKLFEAANNPNLPDVHRADTWLEQGYSPGLIVAVVREGLARKPDVRSLRYFDNALREAHEKRAPASSSSNGAAHTGPPDERVQHHMAERWVDGCWGFDSPEPGRRGCEVSAETLRQHGIDPATGKVNRDPATGKPVPLRAEARP